MDLLARRFAFRSLDFRAIAVVKFDQLVGLYELLFITMIFEYLIRCHWRRRTRHQPSNLIHCWAVTWHGHTQSWFKVNNSGKHQMKFNCCPAAHYPLSDIVTLWPHPATRATKTRLVALAPDLVLIIIFDHVFDQSRNDFSSCCQVRKQQAPP